MHKYNLRDFLARFVDKVDDLEIFKAIDFLLLSSDGPWLAGGAVRRTLNKEPLDSDFDLFFKDEAQLAFFKKRMEDLEYPEINSNEHQSTFMVDDWKVQAIHIQYYESVEAVIESFDFTICQFATDGVHLYCGETSLWDLARKRLALHKLTYGTSTMRRLIKYTRQGYTACGGVLADILETVVSDPNLIHRNVQYVD